MPIQVQYQRGYALRVFDAVGSMGFCVGEDGRLGYFGSGGPGHANPGDWIGRGDDGTLFVLADEAPMAAWPKGYWESFGPVGDYFALPEPPPMNP